MIGTGFSLDYLVCWYWQCLVQGLGWSSVWEPGLCFDPLSVSLGCSDSSYTPVCSQPYSAAGTPDGWEWLYQNTSIISPRKLTLVYSTNGGTTASSLYGKASPLWTNYASMNAWGCPCLCCSSVVSFDHWFVFRLQLWTYCGRSVAVIMWWFELAAVRAWWPLSLRITQSLAMCSMGYSTWCHRPGILSFMFNQ